MTKLLLTLTAALGLTISAYAGSGHDSDGNYYYWDTNPDGSGSAHDSNGRYYYWDSDGSGHDSDGNYWYNDDPN
jgi:hypothetical protein